MSNDDSAMMPLLKHLEELRQRLIKSFLAIGAGACVSYFFKEKILEWLMQPYLKSLPPGQPQKLIYTAPHEAFFTYLKVAFIGGLLLAVPVILFQLWRFIAPGLFANEKRYVFPVVFVSSVFFLGGALFGYYLVFPAGFHFFTSFASDFIMPMITTKEYLSFSLRLLLGFGVVFELPVFVFFLAKMGLVSAEFLRKKRRYAIVLIFIVSMAITPSPDVFSQFMMAGPLLVLYELSVWIAHFFGRKEESKDDASDENERNVPLDPGE